ITGQAWACVIGALLLLATYTNLLRRYGTLTTRASLRIVIGHFAAVAALAALAYALAPTPAKAAPPPGWKLVFEDEFRTLRLWDEGRGVWEPHYPWGSRTNESNVEEQYYIDTRPGRDAAEIMALEPFRVEDGILSIRADVVPESLREKADGHPYAAGLLTTFRSHAFTYGYFEMRARLPAGRGLWPAFWLLPVEIAWPPEIDVMEVLGHDTRSLHVTLHTGQGEDQTKQGREVPTPDMSEDFHVFGVAWTATEVTWFFDGKEVFSAPTPDDMHQPKYLLVNLAVGGEWPGSPDETTMFPASFEIDWIRVWQPDEISHDGKGRR
ncbi:MAG TPA: glycoside hydrolase family 16 protein, partial [Saliniramus sp.]|nr:glycoside hydrolase family 16 protein [Saliniramus sp.]